MDRLNQLRGEAGTSRDSTLDTSSPPSEAYMTANETSSKFFSLSDVDSTFDITPIKDVSSTIDTERTITESDRLISNLSPIGKKNDFLDSYKIGKQIEAANILSGGVAIFDDNDNSYDGDELVIDDNVECEDKSNSEIKLADSPVKEIESTESNLVEAEPVLRKDTTEVILQIDGKNVDAIDIGNGLYLYRRQGEEELAAVQIDENQQQPSYKFLKVRENDEGNLEVYEEIQIEVPKEVPVQEGSSSEASASHVPIRDISEVTCSKVIERKAITQSETSIVTSNIEKDANKDISDTKSEANGKLMKFCESRKSPVVGSFTPMTYHSTPNKEGIPLTKTMVDLQLHPNRHSDNVKKTIEVHTDCAKPKVDQVKLTKENEDNIKLDKHKMDSKIDCELEQGNKNEEKVDSSAKQVKIDKVTSHINESKKDEKQQSDDLPNLSKDKEMEDKGMDISPEPAVFRLTPASIQQTTGIATTDKLHDEHSEMLIIASDANQVSKLSAKEQALEIPINKIVNEADSKSIVDTHSTQQISEQLTQEQQTKVAVSKNSKDVEKKQMSGKSEQQQESKVSTTKKLNRDDSFTKIHTHITSQKSGQLTQQQSIKVASSKKSIEKEVNTEVKTQMTNNEISNQLTQEQVSKVAATEKLNEEDLKRGTVNADDTSQIVELPTKQQATETVADVKLNEPDSVTGVSTKDANQISKDIASQNIKLVSEGIIPSSVKNMLKSEVMPSNLKNDECSVENVCRSTTKEISSARDDKIESANINKAEEDVADRTLKAGDKKIEQENAKHYVGNNKKESILLLEDEKNLIMKEDTKGATNIKIENKNITREENKGKDQLATDVRPVTEVIDSKSHTRHENISKPSDDKKSTLQTDKVKLLPKESKAIADSTTTKTVETKPSRKMDPQTELGSVTDIIKKKEIGNKSLKPTLIHVAQTKDSTMTSKKTLLKVNAVTDQKPISNNHAPVPFGKWTEANRQAFLDKIKETKVPSNSSNGKQIKNSNDLNRRDVLKKIDSHRQTHTNIPSAKVQDFGCSNNRLPIKKEASVFSSKPTQDSKPPVKTEASLLATNPITGKKLVKQETSSKPQADSSNLTVEPAAVNKKDQLQRKEINNQDLIDKTIEDIISRDLPLKSQPDNGNDVMTETLDALQTTEEFDPIEKRMNELHGFGNIERSANSLMHHSGQKTLIKPDVQKLACTKPSKIPNLLPFTNKSQRKGVKENVIDVDSEDEVIDHEPITGDMDLNKKQATQLPEKQEQTGTDISKKEGITEKDFDKFVRRNSVTYENCITVNFDSNEPVVQKDVVLRTYSKNEPRDSNVGSLKQDLHKQSTAASPTQTVLKAAILQNEEINKNYHSKVKMAYQSAMTVKRQLERPITIIEDKPVKVVYMDSCAEFIPKQLNAQGKELSPAKKQSSSIDLCNTTTSDSLDSDILELDDSKLSTETKSKSKHQRKQVLTPVETPELELIEPGDLGLEVSPKKKRKVEEKVEISPKPVVPKKSYLLGRGATADNEVTKPQESPKSFSTEQTNFNEFETSHISHNNTASAIDNLVKAAELLETQSESLNQVSTIVPDADNQQKTPVKRGRGRPRKYPLPEGATDKIKIQTPQKKPRLSDTKMLKSKDTDEDDDDTDDDSGSDGEMIRENWTMGKINENIVCPICDKLFRSENVVFKHVKHCTGPSPNRSDSGSKSPRRLRYSQDYESKSADDKINEEVDDKESTPKEIRKKRKSRETTLKSLSNKDESISVEGTVSKSKLEGAKHEETKKSKLEGAKHEETKKSTLTKNKIIDHKTNNLICEFCGKTFRQLSYLVNHKLQHEKEEAKNHETETKSSKSVFSCEVCKKEFRKLHHLVQHRFIHNSSSVSSAKLLRKSSVEQNENRTSKDQDIAKQSDDTSAGFRCEPCDKSFRKLHHLVEHRETHDGINRQKNPTVSAPVEKAPPPPQCEICKKTFRKLHHLIEHKEQHLETSSEKSDDKSIKSSLSTKDIIHECSLCYMVFPNEHSLNKHTIICQRKKRQSATKQNKPSKEEDQVDENKSVDKTDDDMENDNEVIIVSTEIISDRQSVQNIPVEESQIKGERKADAIPPVVVENIDLSAESPSKTVTEQSKDLNTVKEPEDVVQKAIPDVPQIQEKKEEKVSLKVQETTKKKADKLAPSITKRQKLSSTLPVVDDGKSVESSDDDEIRYMINPDYKTDENVKAKIFMNIRANKRNSLQIERPNSKDLVKRRISLQNPAKVPRLKPKLVQSKPTTAVATAVTKKSAKTVPIETATDSDDSDVKYSFPKITKANTEETTKLTTKETDKKLPRKSLTEKRKSLSTIAKRKSLGKTLSAKHKAKPSPVKPSLVKTSLVKPSPVKPIKKRSAEAEHRCDCGQLFSSAALLSRHTVLAHTPPRIRRRRSPPPDLTAKPPKPTTKPKVSTNRKSSVKTEPDVRATPKNPEPRKSIKTSEPAKSGVTNTKVKRLAAHIGVPVPEKMKKLMEKFKK